MQDLINTFLEEASELITDLEDALLKLEGNPKDMDAINRVFRVMHTLKGSGSMFGYEHVSNFTHKLETLYDRIRSGQKDISTEIFNTTLKSVDHIKALFEVKGEFPTNLSAEDSKLTDEISNLLNESAIVTSKIITEYQTIKDNKLSYLIEFIPDSEIMQNGTNPIYLIDELNGFGEMQVLVHTDKVPTIDLLDAEKSYVSWELILATEYLHHDIVDVFIFVDTSATIKIEQICDTNVFNNSDFKKSLAEILSKNDSLNIEEIKSICTKQKTQENITEDIIQKVIDEKEDTEVEILKKQESAPSNEKQNAKLASSIRVSSLKIEELMNLVSELVTNQASLDLYSKKTGNKNLMDAVENNEKLIRHLRDNALDISLIPLDNLLIRFKRLIRDLSIELGKEVTFITKGTETELDKAIIDQLAEPLMHIFRNALDHGIESRDERQKVGKTKSGTVSMTSYNSGSDVIIEIEDDGHGIDPEKIRKSAIKKGIITSFQNLSNDELIDLIFEPGFSTVAEISEISGRGVGMDVVKKKISDLQGTVKIKSKIGSGTKFIIKIPLTLSIIDGILIGVNDSQYIIGITNIKKIYQIKNTEIENIFNNMITLDGKQYPLINLRKEFNITNQIPVNQQIILITQDNHDVGILADKVLKEVQVVVKPISGSKGDDELVSGAAIMGDGSIALVLNTNTILNNYI